MTNARLMTEFLGNAIARPQVKHLPVEELQAGIALQTSTRILSSF